MPSSNIEIIDRKTNAAIVKWVDRKHPGILMQGDTFHEIFSLSDLLVSKLRKGHISDALDLADELKSLLYRYDSYYEEILINNSIQLPYVKASRLGSDEPLELDG